MSRANKQGGRVPALLILLVNSKIVTRYGSLLLAAYATKSAKMGHVALNVVASVMSIPLAANLCNSLSTLARLVAAFFCSPPTDGAEEWRAAITND